MTAAQRQVEWIYRLALAATAFLFCTPSHAADRLALKGATIYVSPGAAPIKKGVILIEGGRIAAVGAKGDVKIPKGVETVDLSGRTVTAGFWNSHMHFAERKWANAGALPADELAAQIREMLTRYGFTSVFDLSSDLENTKIIRTRIDSGDVSGPRIMTTGEGMIAPGAAPPDLVLVMMGFAKTPLPEIADANAAAQAAARLISEGADGIKLFTPQRGDPFSAGVIKAAVGAAHDAGKPLILHPNTGADVASALAAGVDLIAHTTPNAGPWDETAYSALASRRAALTPTLSLWTWFARHDRRSAWERIAKTGEMQLAGWIAAGGVVLFGTDAGANDYDPYPEYKMMQAAGMDYRAILESLTSAPADFFGADDLGVIAPGHEADLTVLGADPAADIAAFADVVYTIRAGAIIYERPDAP